jgi:restriction system protein
MAIPDFEALTLPMLAIAAEGGAFSISAAADRLADEFDLTLEERSHLLPSRGATSFANRVQWAKTFLVKGGLLEAAGSGRFVITQRGKDVEANPPERIDLTYLRQFPEFYFVRGFHGIDADAVKRAAARAPPDETIMAAYVQIEDRLAEELLGRLSSGPPAFFEKAVLRVLNVMKCRDSSRVDLDNALVGLSGDGDVNGVIDREALDLDPIYVQIKQYGDGSLVGPDSIREFLAGFGMTKAPEGVFAAASSFTAQARDAALKSGKHIMLIDRPQLARLMILYCVGCRVEETLEIKRVFEDFFE